MVLEGTGGLMHGCIDLHTTKKVLDPSGAPQPLSTRSSCASRLGHRGF